MTHSSEVIGIPALFIYRGTTLATLNPWTPLIAATFGWAFSVVINKVILARGVDTVTLVPIRTAFGLLTLLLIAGVTRRFWTRSPRAWKRGAILGVAAMAVPNLVMTRALEDLPVSLGGLLIALMPITTVIAAHFILEDEKFQARSIPGLLIALAGTALLVGVGGETIEGVGNLWRGVSFSLTGVVLAGIGGALTRRFALDVPSEELVLPQFVFCTLFLFLFVPLFFDFQPATVDTGSLLWLIILGVVGTALPFAMFLIAAAINPAWRLGLTGYTVPVLAVAMAVIFLGESLTPAIIGGAVLIVGGVVVADRASSPVPVPEVV
jgi:drug/metabolite transporter (DMT)-like permease